MRLIEQKELALIRVKKLKNSILLVQGSLDIIVDKQGAKQLIEVLKEFVNENQN